MRLRNLARRVRRSRGQASPLEYDLNLLLWRAGTKCSNGATEPLKVTGEATSLDSVIRAAPKSAPGVVAVTPNQVATATRTMNLFTHGACPRRYEGLASHAQHLNP